MEFSTCLRLARFVIVCVIAVLGGTISAQSAGFWATPELTFPRSPLRTVHDGNGGMFVFWNAGERGMNVIEGVNVGRLARVHENTGAVDEAFQWDDRLGSPVTVAVQPDGKILVCVQFPPGDGYGVVRVFPNGAVDGSFNAPRFRHFARYLALQSDGKILVPAVEDLSLPFSPPSGIATAPELALYRLNADGSLDGTFTPAEFDYGILYAPPQIDENGRIYLGGNFFEVNGVARRGIARLAANGQLDPQWGAPENLPAGFWSQPRALLPSGGGMIVVGRIFHDARGSFQNPIVAVRLTDEGAVDANFVQLRLSDIDPALFSIYYPRGAVALADGSFLVGMDCVRRLNSDGTLAEKWPFPSATLSDPLIWLSRSPVTGAVYVPAVTAVAGGVLAYSAQGQLLSGFEVGTWGTTRTPASAVVTRAGEVWVAGRFDRFNATPAPALVVFDADDAPVAEHTADLSVHDPFAVVVGWPDGSFAALLHDYGAYPSGEGQRAEVRRYRADGSRDENWTLQLFNPTGWNFTPLGDGGLLAWRANMAFDDIAALGAGAWLQKFRPDGTRDESFVPDLSMLFSLVRGGTQASVELEQGRLFAVKADADGRIYLACDSRFGGTSVFRLHPDGAVDSSYAETNLGATESSWWWTHPIWDPNTFFSSQWLVTDFRGGEIKDLLVLPDGTAYVAGRMQVAEAEQSLVRLQANGALDGTFAPNFAFSGPLALTPMPTSLGLDHYGRLYVGGRFTQVNEADAPGLARFSAAGVADLNWAPGIAVRDVELNRVLMGANGAALNVFGPVYGPGELRSSGRQRIALTATAPVLIGRSPDRNVAAGSRLALFVGAYGGDNALISWTKNGQPLSGATTSRLDFANVTAADAGVYRLTITNHLGSVTSAPIVLAVGAPVITQQPLLVGGTWGGAASLTVSASFADAYQWYRNGAPINGATQPSLNVNSVDATTAGAYTVQITNAHGSVTSATVNVGTGVYAWFRHEYFDAAEQPNAAISGPNADPDGDGLSNLLEYALGLHPRQASTADLPQTTTTATHWIYTYTRPADRSDVAYTVEASTNLAAWNVITPTHEMITTHDGVETWRASVPLTSAANLFFRLRVEAQ